MQDPRNPYYPPMSPRGDEPGAGAGPRVRRAAAGGILPPGLQAPVARGLAVQGQRFYVWDEDPREASSWGGELASFEGGPRRRGR